MDENEIDNFMLKYLPDPSLYRGCYARGEMVYSTPDSGVYVVNTSSRSSSGTHWFVVDVQNDQLLLYDSLALDLLSDYYLSSFIHSFKRKILFRNLSRAQSYFSDVCGIYVCTFAYAIRSGVTFTEFINMFQDIITKIMIDLL